MDKWYHSLPTAGNCRQSPLRLSNPEPWFMRIGFFLMGMNFHTAFPNGQDSWILDAKQFFGQFVLLNPQAESFGLWTVRLKGAPPHGHRVHRPKAQGQDSDGQSHSAASCSNVAPEKPIFLQSEKTRSVFWKKKKQLIFRQDSRVLGPICQKADSTKTIFLKFCSFFPIFLTTFGTESRHSDRDILQVVLRSN